MTEIGHSANFAPFLSLLVVNCFYLFYPRSTITAILFVLEISSLPTFNPKSSSGSGAGVYSIYSIFIYLCNGLRNFGGLCFLEKLCVLTCFLVLNVILSTKHLFLLIFNLAFVATTQASIISSHLKPILAVTNNFGKVKPTDVQVAAGDNEQITTTIDDFSPISKSKYHRSSEPLHPILISSDIDLEIPPVENILNSTEIESDAENQNPNKSFQRPQLAYLKKYPEGYRPERTLSSARLRSFSTRFLNALSSDDEFEDCNYNYNISHSSKPSRDGSRTSRDTFGGPLERSQSSLSLRRKTKKVRRQTSVKY